MKATDLMIGDWVYAKVQVDDTGTEPVFERTPKMVTDLTNSINGIYVEGTSQFAGAEIEPVPLTPEILEKNGFKKNEYGDFYLDIVAGYVGITVEEIPLSNKLFFEIEYACLGETYHPHTINVQLNYVHELQHALLLCGIDKEIIL